MASSAQHQEIKAALERYTKEELVDLMEHLLRIYVLNEPVKLDSAVSKPESVREFSGYSFSQLLSYLQQNLEMDELGKFRITPYTVYVSIGDAEFDLNGPTPTLAKDSSASESSSEEINEEEMSPAERMDALDNKPWRSAPRPVQAPVSKVETPSMADLFADDSRPSDRTGSSFFMFDEAPTKAEDEDELDAPPPIADVAPGDDPEVASNSDNDFAKAAASREDAPDQQAPSNPPPLAAGDKQIDPSNRFASLDLD